MMKILGLYVFVLSSLVVFASTTYAQKPNTAERITEQNDSAKNISEKTSSLIQIPSSDEELRKQRIIKEDKEAQELDKSSTIKQAYTIINKIKDTNPNYKTTLTVRSGLMQVVGNTPDSVALNQQKTMPYFSFEGVFRLFQNVSLEGRYLIAQNILYAAPADSLNQSGANQTLYDVGARYTYTLDPTKPSNYFAFRVLYHYSENNFQLSNTSDVTMKNYTAVMYGIEKGIPITPKLGVTAGLDGLSIMDSKTITPGQAYEKTGFGFQVRGETYYTTNWLNHPGRLGAMYSQIGYSNKLSDSLTADFGKSTLFQSFRTISLSYTLLY